MSEELSERESKLIGYVLFLLNVVHTFVTFYTNFGKLFELLTGEVETLKFNDNYKEFMEFLEKEYNLVVKEEKASESSKD